MVSKTHATRLENRSNFNIHLHSTYESVSEFSMRTLCDSILVCTQSSLVLSAAINCGLIPSTGVVALAPSDQFFMEGASIRVNCLPGYQVELPGLRGTFLSYFATCTADGTWNGNIDCRGEKQCHRFSLSLKRLNKDVGLNLKYT